MAPRYSNWTLQKCDHHFEKYFRIFDTRKVNNKGMSELKSGCNEWKQFHYVNSDRSFTGCAVSTFINSLNIKIFYRLNIKSLRGEICVRNIHDGISAPSSTGK